MNISRKALMDMLKEYCYGKPDIVYTMHEKNRIEMIVNGVSVSVHNLNSEGPTCSVRWSNYFKGNKLELTLSEFEDFLRYTDRLTKFCFDATSMHNVFRFTEDIALIVRNMFLDKTLGNDDFPLWNVTVSSERIISHVRHVVELSISKDQISSGQTFVISSEGVSGLPGVEYPIIINRATQEIYPLYKNADYGSDGTTLREWLFKFIQ